MTGYFEDLTNFLDKISTNNNNKDQNILIKLI